MNEAAEITIDTDDADRPGSLPESKEQRPAPVPPVPAHAPVHIVIEATRGWASLQLRELWAYRELLLNLALRDISVRYKQTVLGVGWAVLVPFLTMVVFSVLFGLLMGRDNKPTVAGVPYAISTFCALVPWQLFSHALNQASNSIISGQNLITKVYFPRLIIPLAPTLAALVDFVIAFGVLVLMIIGYSIFTDYTFTFSWALLTLPFFTLLTIVTAVAMSLWLSAGSAMYRDVKYIVPFLVQILMYVSPVIYATESIMGRPGVPEWARILYGLNPLAGVMEGFRWAMLGQSSPPGLIFIPSIAMVSVLLLGGMFYFRRMEKTFADMV